MAGEGPVFDRTGQEGPRTRALGLGVSSLLSGAGAAERGRVHPRHYSSLCRARPGLCPEHHLPHPQNTSPFLKLPALSRVPASLSHPTAPWGPGSGSFLETVDQGMGSELAWSHLIHRPPKQGQLLGVWAGPELEPAPCQCSPQPPRPAWDARILARKATGAQLRESA